MSSFDPTLAAHVNENWGTAVRLIDVVSDKRLLIDEHTREDIELCMQSALELRASMGLMIASTTPGPLKQSLREIQAACRAFLSAGGKNGENFRRSGVLFPISLLELRLAVARQVASTLMLFGVDSTPEVRGLLRVIAQNRRP